MKKSIIALALISLVTSVVLFTISCNKQKEIPKAIPVVTQKQNNIAAKTSNACTCAQKPTGCSSFLSCAKKFMGTNTQRNFSINWTSYVGCIPPAMQAHTSTGYVCYDGNCNEMQISFNSDFPACLGCYATPPLCLVVQVVCQGTSYSLQYLSADGTQTINITGDPHISIECNGTSGVYVKLEGDLTWQ